MELASVSVDPSLPRPRRRLPAPTAKPPATTRAVLEAQDPKLDPARRARGAKPARGSRPTLALFGAESRPDGSPTPWHINGHPARIRTWTAAEWETLADRPAIVQVGANGVRVAFDWDPGDRSAEELRDYVLRGKLAPG